MEFRYVGVVMGRMEIKFFSYLILLGGVFGCGMVFSQAKFERLDPHGSKTADLKKMILVNHKECQVCHLQKEKKGELKSNIPGRCILCHGKRPHSGAGEHVGKSLRPVKKEASGEVTCLSCHFAHRARLPQEERPADFEELISHASFLKVKREKGTLPSGLIEKYNFETAMLRVSCAGCHVWK